MIQIASESIHDQRPLDEVFNESDFLRDFRKTAAQHTRGCIVLERPDLIEALADRHGAKDSTARKTAIAELQAANAHRSQYDPEAAAIPEKSWAYRIAKKIAYHDYGVYGEHFEAENWVDPSAQANGQLPSRGDGSDLVQLK